MKGAANSELGSEGRGADSAAPGMVRDALERSESVTEAIIETISRHTHLYCPFDVYAKALQQ